MRQKTYKTDEINFNDKSILITGGAGFIGSNIALYLQNNFPDSRIVVIDIFRSTENFSNGNPRSYGHIDNLTGFKGVIIHGDINDPELLLKVENDYKFNYIFHLAGISDTTADEKDLIIKTNVNSYKSILNIAILHGANIVYASSGAAYGNVPPPQTVGKENPNNFYGLSKLMMDEITFSSMKKDPGISIVGLRFFNVYGPGEFFKNKTSSMVLQFGLQLLRGESPKLFAGSDKILRDFIYIDDVVRASILALNPKMSGVYNVGSGKARSFQDVADLLQNELGTDYGPTYIENPYVGHYQFNTQANMDCTREFLNFVAKLSLEEGIRAYLPEILRIFKAEIKNFPCP